MRGGAKVARVFITGSSDGLGLMAARLLIGQGHEVVLHGRNEGRSGLRFSPRANLHEKKAQSDRPRNTRRHRLYDIFIGVGLDRARNFIGQWISNEQFKGCHRQMIGEAPEWALWVMVGLLAFVMLLPTIKR
jgi:NAD(P)-dependent dehydrogenase (short-subunit alcohol dehydrogenase family)